MLNSTKIAIGFALIAVGGYYGYRYVGGLMIDGFVASPIQPGRVNILGVSTGGRYRIIVQNQIAILQETSGDDSFEAPTDRDAEAIDEGGAKKRVPIKEMLESLQGNEKALGQLISIVNDVKETSLPPVRVYWEVPDLQKALDGDPAMRAKLEQNLGVNLKGMPLPQVQLSALENGIVIRQRVTVNVPVEGKKVPLTGIVLEPYRPRFAVAVEASYVDKQVTKDQIRGYVVAEARKVQDDPKLLEDVGESIRARIRPEATQRLAAPAERLLGEARVIANESMFEDARVHQYSNADGKPLYDLIIDLTDEGRKRLWKYTRDRVGSQLMLVVDGVAIAAPRVTHELAQSQATITQLQDGVLVRGAIEALKESKEGKR